MQPPVKSTLLDLVRTLTPFTDDDRKVVATITSLVNSGQVRLCGNFAGVPIDLAPPHPTTPQQSRLLS